MLWLQNVSLELFEIQSFRHVRCGRRILANVSVPRLAVGSGRGCFVILGWWLAHIQRSSFVLSRNQEAAKHSSINP